MSLHERPSWVSDAIFYQIFPDRFARSDRVTKPANLLPWSSPPAPQGYHGGDLLGIVEHLDHLVDLGVNALYLTPIFQSACNHRYHTHDYYQVDPLLGGNAALRTLVDALHQRDMRIVLDGVFNHASRGFFPFNDVLENGPHSPWLGWFHIHGWPLAPYNGDRPANYGCWTNNRALPDLNTDNPQVREYIMGIAEHWIREYDIDGWRLDVPEEIRTPGFWEEFRERVRGSKSDAYLVGEIWREAADWLRGDRFDATMNYPFAAAAIAFAAGDRVSQKLVEDRSYDPYPGLDAVQFGDRISRLLATYDWETTCVQLNLLDSHDAPRVLSIARGDTATVRLATLIQMTFPGAPCIYYGDEVGLRGTKRYDGRHRDQDARWPFPWHDESLWNRELLESFRCLIELRKQHPALRRGRYEQLWAEGRQFAYLRGDSTDQLIVAVNAGDEDATVRVPVAPRFHDGRPFDCLLGGLPAATVEQGRLSLTVPRRDGVVMAVRQ